MTPVLTCSCMFVGSTNILEGQGLNEVPRAPHKCRRYILLDPQPHLIAAGALPDTYWARELEVDLEEWNTYIRCVGSWLTPQCPFSIIGILNQVTSALVSVDIALVDEHQMPCFATGPPQPSSS